MLINSKTIKTKVFFLIAFCLLFLSYTANLWLVSPKDYFHGFEKGDEALVIGRLIKAEDEGIFSYGGFPGIAYNTDSISDINEARDYYQIIQHHIYLTEQPAPEKFSPYLSQNGGQAITYSVIQKVLPLSNSKVLQVCRALNALLTALCFTLFLGWCNRNYGLLSTAIVFILLLMSPWINNFAHSLWWSFWSFYVPFLCILLLLEKKHKNPRSISNVKILLSVFIAVLVKCLFTGFEFITTTLLAIISPIVYYIILERASIGKFIATSFKVGISAILGVAASIGILLLQVKSMTGSFSDGINHLIYSYEKRALSDVILNGQPALTYSEVLKRYFGGDALSLGCFGETGIGFHFAYWLLIMAIFGVIVWLSSKGKKFEEYLKSKALIATTLFSILCPLSWFIIFKQHASEHPHLDYIVWYIPFMLFGFLLIGSGISAIKSRLTKKEAHSY